MAESLVRCYVRQWSDTLSLEDLRKVLYRLAVRGGGWAGGRGRAVNFTAGQSSRCGANWLDTSSTSKTRYTAVKHVGYRSLRGATYDMCTPQFKIVHDRFRLFLSNGRRDIYSAPKLHAESRQREDRCARTESQRLRYVCSGKFFI